MFLPIQFRPGTFISEITSLLDPLTVFEGYSDDATIHDDQQDNCKRIPMLGFANCIAIRPDTGRSVTVTNKSARLFYMTPNPNWR